MIQMKETFWAFDPKGAHSKYSPSSYSRWKACPASIKMSEGIVIEAKHYNIRGTLCHDIAEALVRREYLIFPYLPPWQITAMLKVREEEEHDSDEILWVAKGAIDAVDYFMQFVGEVHYLLLEKKIPILGEKWGSADVCIIGSKATVILDHKFGNAKVTADSLQLKSYLMGVYANMVNMPPNYRFIAGIYQPAVSIGYDEWVYSPEELADGLEILAMDIAETQRDNLLPNEGNHCFFCPASQTPDPDRKCPIIKMKMSDRAGAKLLEAYNNYYEGN